MNCNSKYTIAASLYILKRRYTKDNLAGNCSSIRENLECWDKGQGKFRYSKGWSDLVQSTKKYIL